MAGEYVRWLARDVKPREKQELTPQEKRRNWWVYHRFYVLLALAAVILVGDVIYDAVQNNRNRPDYVLSYVGETPLPEELELILEEGLAQLGEDRNGNGEIRVDVRQFPAEALPEGYVSSLPLVGSIEANESVVFLLEDPERFQATYPILEEAQCLRWGDCPALTALELPVTGIQELLANLTLARRELWNGEPDEGTESGLDLWERITAGAASRR